MSHIMKYTEWESNGNWYSRDVSDLTHNSDAWWLPARMLNISLTDYIMILKNDYHAFDFRYFQDVNILLWKWNYNDCHKFTLWINREARNRKFKIC